VLSLYRQGDFAQSVADALKHHGVRASADLRNEKISYKIREHSLQKVPYLLVVGDKEKEGGYVSLRSRNGEDLGQMSVAEECERLRLETSVNA
jgi:threonyl-tRNA synthetase